MYFSELEPCTILSMMQCSHCQSNQTVKNGRRNGIQNYRCRSCRRQFAAVAVVNFGKHTVLKATRQRSNNTA
ncbi:IS1/IS1595 family N-terminal zinc-binding domain-containing protein [Parathermosynechococcus lividus]